VVLCLLLLAGWLAAPCLLAGGSLLAGWWLCSLVALLAGGFAGGSAGATDTSPASFLSLTACSSSVFSLGFLPFVANCGLFLFRQDCCAPSSSPCSSSVGAAAFHGWICQPLLPVLLCHSGPVFVVVCLHLPCIMEKAWKLGLVLVALAPLVRPLHLVLSRA
jgi:hypothetical protein